MKISGYDLNDFLTNAWPGDDWYWEHELFEDEAEDDQMYDTDEISGFHWQGDGPAPAALDVETVIADWLQDRTRITHRVSIPREAYTQFLEALNKIDGYII